MLKNVKSKHNLYYFIIFKINFNKFLLITIIFTVLTGCSNDTSLQTETTNAQSFAKPGDDVASAILRDTTFSNYIIQNDKFLDKIVDAQKAQYMLEDSKDTDFTLEESDIYAQYLGFSTFKELNAYYYRQQQRLLILDKKYKLFSLSSEDINYIATEGQIRLNLPTNNYTTYKNCRDRFSNCKLAANATYIAGAVACVGGGALIAGLSAGTLSAAATWGSYVCLGANAAILHTSLRSCVYAYEDCMEG